MFPSKINESGTNPQRFMGVVLYAASCSRNNQVLKSVTRTLGSDC